MASHKGKHGIVRKPEEDTEDPSVRSKMLSAAMALFNRKGYASTTVREIVAEAGVTKPMLYYYFGNKEGIYKRLMEPPFVNFEVLLRRFQERKGTARQLLAELCDQLFLLFSENIEVVRIMYSIYYGPAQGAPFIDFDAYHMNFQDTVRRLIAAGSKNNEFRKEDTESLMWAVIGAVNIAMEMQLSHPDKAVGRDGLGRVLNLILKGAEENRRTGRGPGKKRVRD